MFDSPSRLSLTSDATVGVRHLSSDLHFPLQKRGNGAAFFYSTIFLPHHLHIILFIFYHFYLIILVKQASLMPCNSPPSGGVRGGFLIFLQEQFALPTPCCWPVVLQCCWRYPTLHHSTLHFFLQVSNALLLHCWLLLIFLP